MLKVAFSPIFLYQVPEKHRFPMQKYRLIPERLVQEGTLSEDNFFAPSKVSEQEILTTHTAEYWDKLKTQALSRKEARAIGFEMTPELVERGRYIAHATYECALYAKQYGVSLNVAGGTHHSFADHGEGFCVFNDVCIASNLLLSRGEVNRILIVDLDVHQGNGNASIMANEPRVLPNETDDETYLNILKQTLPRLIAEHNPDLIFYQSAVDVLATDKLGKLSLTLEGCKQRDEFVLSQAKAHNIPIAIVMGGGYSEEVEQVVEAHCNTFRLAKQLFFG